MNASTGACAKCRKPSYVMPLHGDRGGPLMCPICIGAWNAEYTKRRKWGRIIVKAMNMYLDEGGQWSDLERFKLAAGNSFGLATPIAGYSTSDLAADVPDITTELLSSILQLVHPDRHPPERQDLAKSVTQDLLALKPFVFPAPKPKAPPKPCHTSIKPPRKEINEPLRKPYPCELCVGQLSDYYCTDCKAELEKERQRRKEAHERDRERRNARQRARYADKRGWALEATPTPVCAMCGDEFTPKRLDAKYCSSACRQKAHRKRAGRPSNSKPLGRAGIEERVLLVFETEPENAFTTRELCERIYPEERIRQSHRASVVAAAKGIIERQWREAPEAAWEWRYTWTRGSRLVFFNPANLKSYAMWELKSLWTYRHGSDARLRAGLEPGGQYHQNIVEGGAWHKNWQSHLAEIRKNSEVDTDSSIHADGKSTTRNDPIAEASI